MITNRDIYETLDAINHKNGYEPSHTFKKYDRVIITQGNERGQRAYITAIEGSQLFLKLHHTEIWIDKKECEPVSRLSLYRTRKQGTPYPVEFVKVVITNTESWFVINGVLTPNEIERCDLNYCGHGMTYETAMAEIERLRKHRM